jgi:hypothetical protein
MPERFFKDYRPYKNVNRQLAEAAILADLAVREIESDLRTPCCRGRPRRDRQRRCSGDATDLLAPAQRHGSRRYEIGGFSHWIDNKDLP